MPRALSLHIGVDHPSERLADRPLQHSEHTAWRMAELASQAGYDALQVLRGAAATRAAVHQALSAAAGTLAPGDTMLLSFSGHGTQQRDPDGDERDGRDESWCLYDGLLMDDTLFGYWSLFERGVRIVVVAESCHSGGVGRKDPDEPWERREPGPVRWRGSPPRMRGPGDDLDAACLVQPPRHHDGIRASVLVLTAAGEEQLARDGLFTRCLLELWDGGTFHGSYAELYSRVRQRVMSETSAQEPRIVLLGAADPDFARSPAFHLERGPGVRRGRGGAWMVD